MPRKLDILIPQYKEDDSIIKPLLDSISLQKCVDLTTVGVIICNDGSDVKLSEELLSSYPFDIEYYQCEHRGVSATRNACLDHSRADYVMFCDADDMFYNMCGLWILFREMEIGEFDSLVSLFVEETLVYGTKEHIFTNREMDSTFVHGKVHRRQYLVDKNIRFNDNLTIHEDSFFNILVQNCSTNVKYCQTPFYLWCWRDESVCRHDDKYILKTYNNLLDSNDALVDEFIRRGMSDKAAFYCCMIVFDAYYTMNKQEWLDSTNIDYRKAVEERFKKYFHKHKSIWEGISNSDKVQISNGVRGRVVGEGMLMEAVTINDWLSKFE